MSYFVHLVGFILIEIGVLAVAIALGVWGYVSVQRALERRRVRKSDLNRRISQ